MEFARWTFRLAGIWGLLILTPQLFLESQIGRDYPPAITHPEFFYGFTGVALAWQFAFLVISRDPARFRPLMLPAILEKASFVLACLSLYANSRIPFIVLGFAMTDLAWGIAFTISYLWTGPRVVMDRAGCSAKVLP